MRHLLLLIAACFACACCSSASSSGDAGAKEADLSAAARPDGAMLAACLDRPAELARPPAGKLPCELIPPGLHLSVR